MIQYFYHILKHEAIQNMYYLQVSWEVFSSQTYTYLNSQSLSVQDAMD